MNTPTGAMTAESGGVRRHAPDGRRHGMIGMARHDTADGTIRMNKSLILF
ncbi:hypothetical protein [Leyella lascolaii]|nr:hypothetical protein [Leyella lascolaii]